ncbi:hypothetical protein GCM10023259_082100 [Thermocatellispora tengchongensis]
MQGAAGANRPVREPVRLVEAQLVARQLHGHDPSVGGPEIDGRVDAHAQIKTNQWHKRQSRTAVRTPKPALSLKRSTTVAPPRGGKQRTHD